MSCVPPPTFVLNIANSSVARRSVSTLPHCSKYSKRLVSSDTSWLFLGDPAKHRTSRIIERDHHTVAGNCTVFSVVTYLTVILLTALAGKTFPRATPLLHGGWGITTDGPF